MGLNRSVAQTPSFSRGKNIHQALDTQEYLGDNHIFIFLQKGGSVRRREVQEDIIPPVCGLWPALLRCRYGENSTACVDLEAGRSQHGASIALKRIRERVISQARGSRKPRSTAGGQMVGCIYVYILYRRVGLRCEGGFDDITQTNGLRGCTK